MATNSSRGEMRKLEFVALMAALMAADVLAIDIMLPGLPQIGDSLGLADPNDRSLILTAFLIGFGLPQLIFGPITDRFGRRTMILAGLGGYLAATIACAFSPTFAFMLVARFLQGCAASAIRVGMMATVRDRYSGSAMAEIMSLVLAIFLLVPIACPTIGQLLLFVGPWPLIFIFMGVLALAFGVWTWARLAETLAPENRRSLDFSVVAEGFRIVVSNRRAFFYGIVGAFMYGIIVGTFSTAQQVYTEIFDFGDLFPLAFGMTAGIAAVTTLVISRIIRRIGMRRVGHSAVVLIIAVNVAFGALSLAGPLTFPVYFCTLLLMFPAIVATFNTTGALSMEPLGDVAGTASSVFGAIGTVGGAGCGLFVAQFYDGTLTPIFLCNALIAAGAMVSIVIAEKGRLFGRDHAPVSAAPAEVML